MWTMHRSDVACRFFLLDPNCRHKERALALAPIYLAGLALSICTLRHPYDWSPIVQSMVEMKAQTRLFTKGDITINDQHRDGFTNFLDHRQ